MASWINVAVTPATTIEQIIFGKFGLEKKSIELFKRTVNGIRTYCNWTDRALGTYPI